jgi:hypothetical protein
MPHNKDALKLILRKEMSREKWRVCCSNVKVSGVNGDVIMSGWKDDNPDNERRETTGHNTTSVSKRANRGASGTGDGSQRTAVLPGQSPGREGRSEGSGSWQPWTAV